MSEESARVSDEGSIVDTAALTVELETWRKRMFRRLSPTRDHFPELRRVATDREPDTAWTAQEYPPIRDFLIKALDHAQASQAPGQPPDAYSPAVLRCVFGLTDRTMNATVRERQVAATSLIPGAYSHYELTEPEVRGPQVEVLIAAIQAWHTARRAASPPARRATGGTERLFGRAADLEWLTQMRNQLKDTGGLFGIWGLSGIGKTALADQFAWNIGPERCATIRVGQPGRYAEDLRSALTKAGHPVPDAPTEQYEAAFRRYAGDLGDIWLLILDGVTDPSQLDTLGLDNVRIPVLVVAEERFSPGFTRGQPGAVAWRHVAPLSRAASSQLLTQHMPETRDLDSYALDNLKALAAVTGGHAATLEAVSRLLPELTEQDIEDLVEQVGRTPGQSLASLVRFTGDRELRAVAKPLSWIIRHKLAQLVDDPVATTVLTVVVTCSDSGTLLREFIDPVVTDMLGRTPWSWELDFACDRLAQIGLATVEGDEVSTGRLVCHLARYEVLDRITAALLAYERVMAEPAGPWSMENYQLKYRRKLYEIASHCGFGHEAALDDPANSRLVLIDENYLAHYITAEDGIRHVTLYRLLASGMAFKMSGLVDGWIPVTEEDYEEMEPLMDGFFERTFNAKLDPASLEAKFGQDQSKWPRTVRDAVPFIDEELARQLDKIDSKLT